MALINLITWVSLVMEYHLVMAMVVMVPVFTRMFVPGKNISIAVQLQLHNFSPCTAGTTLQARMPRTHLPW